MERYSATIWVRSRVASREDVGGFDGAEEILRAWRNGLRPDPDFIVEDRLLIEPSCNPVVGAAVRMPIYWWRFQATGWSGDG